MAEQYNFEHEHVATMGVVKATVGVVDICVLQKAQSPSLYGPLSWPGRTSPCFLAVSNILPAVSTCIDA